MSDIQKLIELEIGFRDSISKRLDTVKSSVESLSEKLKNASKIDTKPIEAVDKGIMNSVRSAHRMEKALDVSHKMLKDFGVEGIPDALKDLQKLNKMSDDDVKTYQNLIDKKVKYQKEILAKKEEEQEVEESLYKNISRRLSEVREEQDIANAKFETFKDLAGSSAAKIADMVGFGNEFSTVVGKMKSVFGVLNKLFLEPAKKRMDRDKIFHYTIMKNGKLEHKFATYKNKAELKAIESVVKSRTKASKLGLKQAAQVAAASGGGGGGGGAVTAAGAAGADGAGGMAGMASMLPALMNPAGIAVTAVAVAIGAVVAAALVAKKALSEASAVMEEFHTINYNAVGSASAITEAVADLAGEHSFLVDEVKKSTKALTEQGFIVLDANGKMSKMFEQLSVKVASYARTTGLAEEEVAKFLKTQRGLGTKTLAEAEKALLKLANAMQRYGFNTAEANEILKATQELLWKFNVTLGYGAESADILTSMMIKGGKAAKALGMDISVVKNLLNEMSNDFTKFIVATGGKSLEGPEAAMSALIDSIGNVEDALKGTTAFERDIILKNVYGLDEQQLKWAARMKEDTIAWKKELEKTALANGASQEEILKIQKMGAREYLKSVDDSEKLITNIEQAAKETNNNTDRIMNLLSDKVKAILIKLGVKLMPIFIKIGKIMLDVFEEVYKWMFGDGNGDIFKSARESIDEAFADVSKTMVDSAKESKDAAELKELSNKYDKEEKALREARALKVGEKGAINQVEYERGLADLAAKRKALSDLSTKMEEEAAQKAADEWRNAANDTMKASETLKIGMEKRNDKELKPGKLQQWWETAKDAATMIAPGLVIGAKTLKTGYDVYQGNVGFGQAFIDQAKNVWGTAGDRLSIPFKYLGTMLENKNRVSLTRENNDVASEKVTEKQKEKSALDERAVSGIEALVNQQVEAERQRKEDAEKQLNATKATGSSDGMPVNQTISGGMRSPK